MRVQQSREQPPTEAAATEALSTGAAATGGAATEAAAMGATVSLLIIIHLKQKVSVIRYRNEQDCNTLLRK
jgi:hypothetical protein